MKMNQRRNRRLIFEGNGLVLYTGEAIIDQFEIILPPLENDGEEDDIKWSAKGDSLIRKELDSGESIKSYNTVTRVDTTSQIVDPHTKCCLLLRLSLELSSPFWW